MSSLAGSAILEIDSYESPATEGLLQRGGNAISMTKMPDD
jgi:hypothetical protein